MPGLSQAFINHLPIAVPISWCSHGWYQQPKPSSANTSLPATQKNNCSLAETSEEIFQGRLPGERRAPGPPRHTQAWSTAIFKPISSLYVYQGKTVSTICISHSPLPPAGLPPMCEFSQMSHNINSVQNHSTPFTTLSRRYLFKLCIVILYRAVILGYLL